jgi:hypothetical protein
MTSHLPQAALDRLASSWSRLDQARPRERARVPLAIRTLSEWMACALVVDDDLSAFLGGAYLAARAEERGGPQLLGLRYAARFLDGGHPLEQIVLAGTGSPHLFWELYWRPDHDLPAHLAARSAVDQHQEAYRLHLAGREVRTPAASMTTFLLSMAVALAPHRHAVAEES